MTKNFDLILMITTSLFIFLICVQYKNFKVHFTTIKNMIWNGNMTSSIKGNKILQRMKICK